MLIGVPAETLEGEAPTPAARPHPTHGHAAVGRVFAGLAAD